MTCPDASQLDRGLDDPQLQAELAGHLADCSACRRLSGVLAELPELLARPVAWVGDCLEEDALLEVLSGGTEPAHLASCDACRAELGGLREALEEAPRVPSPLEARLRALTEPRRASRRLRVRRGSGRRRGRSARLERPRTPGWAWATLAAAAAILVALALVLRPAPPAQVAVGPRPVTQAPTERVQPTVSATVDPAYPLPTPPVAEPTEAPAVEAGSPSPSPTSPPRSGPTGSPTSAVEAPVVAPPLPPIRDDGGALHVDLARVGGTVERMGPAGWEPLRSGTLESGDRLRAGAEGAFLSLEEGRYEVCLAPGSESAVRETLDGAVLDLVQGRLRAEVVSLRAGERFDVVTRQGRFGVLGTIFCVEDNGEEPSRLWVSEGTVAAQGALGRGAASAGESLLVARRVTTTSYDAQALAWADRLAPEREVLQATRFEDETDRGGFGGELDAGRLRLELLDGDRAWGVGARSQDWSQAADRDVYLRVVVTSQRDVLCRVQAQNATQDKLVQAELELKAGHPRTLTIPVLALTTDYDPARNPVRPGDRLEDLRVLAGGPGEAPQVHVDEVSVYRKRY